MRNQFAITTRVFLFLMVIAMVAYSGEYFFSNHAFANLLKAKANPADEEKLGKAIFFDKNLSNPPGTSCASCHDPEAGYTSARSDLNASFGIMPGALEGRFHNRRPPTIAYSKYCLEGPPFYDGVAQSYFGGFFLDGRAPNLFEQVHFPIFSANEMNNTEINLSSERLFAQKVDRSSYSELFKKVYGADVMKAPSSSILDCLARAIVSFETSREVSPLSSKYDAYLAGKAKLTDAELEGLQLVTGSQTGRPGGPPSHKDAQCILCHGITTEPILSNITGIAPAQGPDVWTLFSYENIGAPKNPNNPYYSETNGKSNPKGYNKLGSAYVDLGLGDYIYPSRGLPPGNLGPGSNGKGDFLAINGKFKVPTLRNVDKRSNEKFVRAYMHNGYFKSLKDVVHFYNTRNLTSVSEELIDFTSAHPYSNLKGTPIWPPPESPSPVTLQNPEGLPGQIGNLELTEREEDSIVAFLKTLSDGYTSK